MKKPFLIIVCVCLSLCVAACAFGQATLSTTSLTFAVNGPSPSAGSSQAMQNQFVLGSLTNVLGQAGLSGSARSVLFVDREEMAVMAVSSLGSVVTVTRGFNGTFASAHNAGATVYVGTPDQFFQFDPSGACTVAATKVTPWINLLTGSQWNCIGALWTLTGGPYFGGGGGLPYNACSTLACNGSTNDTAALATLLGTIGSTQATVYFSKQSVLGSITIPTNVTLDFTAGGSLSLVTGQVVTITGGLHAGLAQIFYNANPTQGAVDFTGDFQTPIFYPEWWGCTYNSGTAGCNGGLQAAIYAAYGCNTSPATTCRTNATSGPKYNRVLYFSNLYNVNVEMKVYHMIGFRWEGENSGSLGAGIQTTNAANLRILDMQSVAYGTFSHLTFSNSSGSANSNALVDLDYSGAQGVDLKPQNVTFEYCNFFGNYLTDVGVLIAKSGGAAQGDNIRSLFSYFSGFSGAAWQVGGNGIGRNVGRSYDQNALNQQIIGGDMQNNPLYGIAVYGGTIEVDNVTFENNTAGASVGAAEFQTGVDMYCESPAGSAPCVARDIRSESLRLAAGGPWSITDSYMGAQWATTFETVAGNSWPTNGLITGTWVGGDGKYYQVTTGGTFGGLALTTPTSGSSTTLVNSGAAYTVNIFTGSKISILGTSGAGTDAGCYGIVTSNSATTITFSAGLVTDYGPSSGLTCVATPDTTSKFVIEPNWGTQTTSGAAIFALFDFNVLDGPFANGTVGAQFILNNVNVKGGKINATGTFTNVGVSRADWMPSSAYFEKPVNPSVFQNVSVYRVGIPSSLFIVPWGLPRANITGYKNYSQFQLGSQPLCWAAGDAAGTHSTVDACINPDATLGANLGRLQLLNNSSGTLKTWNLNADGSSVFPGSLQLGSSVFASLPAAPANGTLLYCSDCKNVTDDTTGTFDSVAASGGHGTNVLRENGAWRVH